MTTTANATNTVLTRFGHKLRRLRKARGWSQEIFAQQCGLDRSYVGGVERGSRNISLVNIERMAESLGVTVEQFFNDNEGVEPRDFCPITEPRPDDHR